MSKPTLSSAAIQRIIDRAIATDDRLARKTQQVLKRLEEARE